MVYNPDIWNNAENPETVSKINSGVFPIQEDLPVFGAEVTQL